MKNNAIVFTRENNSNYTNRAFDRLNQYVDLIQTDVKKWCEENNYHCYNPQNVVEFVNQIKHFEECKFSEDDTFNFLINTEEIDPRIPEDEALKMMKKITNKYQVNERE